MKSEEITISVIIATYNRADTLVQTLNALTLQTLAPTKFDVIIINDGSTDDTYYQVSKIADNTTLRINYFYQKNKGPAAARNRGIKEATGKYIAFTDDDCLPHPNWLNSIITTLDNSNWVGIQGSTYTDKKNITPLTHQIDNTSGNASVPTCNAAYTKKVLLEINGFDEGFPYPHNEDADLAWRISKLGKIGFCQHMLVYHPPRKDAFHKISKRMKILESEFRLYYKDKKSYIINRAKDPWMNIYWEIGIKTQWYYIKQRFRYSDRPTLLLQGLTINLLWWLDLCLLLPTFIKAARKNKMKFDTQKTAIV